MKIAYLSNSTFGFHPYPLTKSLWHASQEPDFSEQLRAVSRLFPPFPWLSAHAAGSCICPEPNSDSGTLKNFCSYNVSRLTKGRSYLKSYKPICVGKISSSFFETGENRIVCINTPSCSWSTQPLQTFQLYLTKKMLKPTSLSAVTAGVKRGPAWTS